MKVLDAYAGAGGGSTRWEEFKEITKITAIEYNHEIAEEYKLRFPNREVIITDAKEYIRKHYQEFEIIIATPPCQKNSIPGTAKRLDITYPDMDYLEIIGLLLNDHCRKTYRFKGTFVIENVKAYWHKWITFKEPVHYKKIGRHHYWSNFKLKEFKARECKGGILRRSWLENSQQYKKRITDYLGIELSKEIYIKHGTDKGKRKHAVYRNMIHPEEGHEIMKQAIKNERNKQNKQ